MFVAGSIVFGILGLIIGASMGEEVYAVVFCIMGFFSPFIMAIKDLLDRLVEIRDDQRELLELMKDK
ncbi:hypothetical protein EZV73_22340 [Acidaminobacter sp. JC074]|uniref:hypothetical protein n=1 Tax=Acidaminobacter sp. JC074 TaxID=2530199 RepID=UPI001F0E658B|nr:hypothetical protein [Acidaminobacter sp. JC074]MCH4890339.1 hypothetical protein [Acidaminobacter sp. JC074]